MVVVIARHNRYNECVYDGHVGDWGKQWQMMRFIMNH